ncbi:ABC transporter ATP-binding protein [Nonomuraea gerenzanensis]|uniref:Putative ABC transporter, ATP-binding protein n=1 Tax=Nonomuraea gerenzanensis TaxID=93944 RepID=A0A1M4E3L0_9ACTN|nr:ABC transporter ATP-binding protein [Nonomuraea gerenzanensis]UBU15581.1 ABC transporter ATP-binding protein [Nonomuraea gerenzanensis]SBO93350.1 putative ABC transporter, ATP-binding protein [Nonomuraea gerenzanensis]
MLSVNGLTVRQPASGRTLLSGVSFEAAPGESVAIVGESGSGKSLTVRALLGLLPAGLESSGEIHLGGHRVDGDPRTMRRLRGGTVSLLMQDPFTLLNPLRKAGRQIADGLPAGADRAAEVTRLLAEVGLGAEVAGRYPFQLSGGMRQRVGLAAALAAGPRILVADEPTTALDATTQREVLALIRRVQRARDMTFLLITHDLRVAFSMCDRIVVMYAGRVVEIGTAAELRARPRHPYTRALLAAEPPADRRLAVLPSVPGSVPAHDAVAGRCGFADRCAHADPRCRVGTPELRPAPARRERAEGGGWLSACVRADELPDQPPPPPAVVTPARTSADAVLAIRDLRKTYRGTSRPALDGVSLTVAPGEIVAVVGESGSGKTTLARCVTGLERPDSGTILLDGQDCSDYTRLPRRAVRRARRTAQMIFQDPYSTLNPARTVRATLKEALQADGRPPDVAALLELVGLDPALAAMRPAGLSGGERQRVAIARAVAGEPRLLVCDEPVSALDVSVQAQVLTLLAGLRERLSMGLLFITHDLAVVRQLADRLYVLRAGQCVESGEVARVLDGPSHPYTRELLASVPDGSRAWP